MFSQQEWLEFFLHTIESTKYEIQNLWQNTLCGYYYVVLFCLGVVCSVEELQKKQLGHRYYVRK